MPEKTKDEADQDGLPPETENSPVEKTESEEEGNWSRDQKNRSYYYDDGYGYEIYNPDEDDETGNC